jgi:phosphomannomutase
MTSYLFDIDGTLTLPRQPINPKFEEFFFNWMQGKKVYFVTGSDLTKVYEQLTPRITQGAAGIFCSMANEFYVDGRLIYANELELPEKALEYLKIFFKQSQYSPKKGNNLEYRRGMLNFSIAGRDSSNEEREQYYLYDLKNNERKQVANFINANFDNLEARIGGQISIDIQNKGNNKSLASKWIRKNIGGKILFFGDKTDRDGNDYDIVKDIVHSGDGEWYSIQSPEQLQLILETK